MAKEVLILSEFSKKIGYKTNRVLQIIRSKEEIKELLFKTGRSFAILKEDLCKFSNQVASNISTKFKQTFFDFLNLAKPILMIFSSKKMPKKIYENSDFLGIQKPFTFTGKSQRGCTLKYGCTIKAYDIDSLTENKFEYDLLINKLQSIFSPDRRIDLKELDYVKQTIELYNGKVLEDIYFDGDDFKTNDCKLNYFVTGIVKAFYILKTRYRTFRFSIPNLGLNLSYSYYTFDVITSIEHLYSIEHLIKNRFPYDFRNYIDNCKIVSHDEHMNCMTFHFLETFPCNSNVPTVGENKRNYYKNHENYILPKLRNIPQHIVDEYQKLNTLKDLNYDLFKIH